MLAAFIIWYCCKTELSLTYRDRTRIVSGRSCVLTDIGIVISNQFSRGELTAVLGVCWQDPVGRPRCALTDCLVFGLVLAVISISTSVSVANGDCWFCRAVALKPAVRKRVFATCPRFANMIKVLSLLPLPGCVWVDENRIPTTREQKRERHGGEICLLLLQWIFLIETDCSRKETYLSVLVLLPGFYLK